MVSGTHCIFTRIWDHGFVNYFASLCNPAFDNIRSFNVSIYFGCIFSKPAALGRWLLRKQWNRWGTGTGRLGRTESLFNCLLFTQLQNDMIKDLHWLRCRCGSMDNCASINEARSIGTGWFNVPMSVCRAGGGGGTRAVEEKMLQ